MKNRIFSLIMLLIIENSLQAIQWQPLLKCDQVPYTWLNNKQIDQLSFKEKIIIGAFTAVGLSMIYGAYKIGSLLLKEHGQKPHYPEVLESKSSISPILTVSHAPAPEKKSITEEQPELTIEQKVHDAFAQRDLDALNALLNQGLDINVKVIEEHTLLGYACFKGMDDWVEYFLDRGADPDSANTVDNYPPLVAVFDAPISANNKRKIIELLLDAGADVNTKVCDCTALFAVVFDGNLDLVKFLLKRGAIKIDGNGMTILMVAAGVGHKNIVSFLLQEELVDINDFDLYGYTALTHAVLTLQRDIVTLLLQAGAEIHLKWMANEQSILFMVGKNGMMQKETSPISCSMQRTLKKDIIQLLLQAGADINVQDSKGHSLLSCAVSEGDTELAEFLLKEGANPNIVDHAAWTPLVTAIVKDREEIVPLLLKAKADPHIKDINGRTLLMIAALYNQPIIIKHLLYHGVDPFMTDKDGKTALDHAYEKGHLDCTEIIELYCDHELQNPISSPYRT